MDMVTSTTSRVNENPGPDTRPEFWGACLLTGSIPRWCPKRFDNSDTLLRGLAETAIRQQDTIFAVLALTCRQCRIAVMERIGVEQLLVDFMRHSGTDIVGALDDGNESPLFQPGPLRQRPKPKPASKPVRISAKIIRRGKGVRRG